MSRIQKSNGTIYWYGLGGQVPDETNLSGSLTNEYVFFGGKRIARRDSSSNIFYYFADDLGTSREIVQSGQTTACYDADFYPYGGEIAPHVNSCPQTYKFTGKERDAESGLDDFGARYDTSNFGRFTTPDPLGGDLTDPQTLNKYSYVRNDPTSLIDPTGLYTCADQGDCQSKQDKAFENARQNDLKSSDPDVVRAAKAYGDPTKDNGVNVGFADLSKNNEGGVTTSTLGTDSSNGSLQAKSNVVIDTRTVNSGGSGLDAVVGHEGSHVADAQDLVSSIKVTDVVKGTFTVGQDITQYASEQRAYHVTDSIVRSEGTHETFQCGVGTCQLGNTVLRGQVTGIVDQILRTNYKSAVNNQPLTAKNPGGSVVPH